MASATEPEPPGTPSVTGVDPLVYALFSDHADRPRHERDRRHYRATTLSTSFDLYLARVYGLGWALGLLVGLLVLAAALALPVGLVRPIGSFLASGLPILNRLSLPSVPRWLLGLVLAVPVTVLVRELVVRLGGRYLAWLAAARAGAIERTLPGAVRYLRVLASGQNDPRAMLSRVATQDAYGATGEAFQRALNRASLSGSLNDGLSMVAKDTASRDLLAPFLLKFREHAAQGGDSLEGYLRMEGRLLSHQQERVHERATGYLELLAELFVVLLVFPALGVLILTLLSVLAPGLQDSIATPIGPVTAKGLIIYSSGVFLLVVGAGAAWSVARIRPTDQAAPSYECPPRIVGIVRSALRNPASATVAFLPIGGATAIILFALGYTPLNVVLLSYAAYGIPVGVVAVRRAGRDDAKDREIRDFVHAVSGHVSLGRPFPHAVERVADEVDLGELQPDVDDLAFNLNLRTSGRANADVQAAALNRFVDRVGTPLAAQTIGLVVGALEAGSDTEDVFETLETEIGRLYHERKSLRSRLLVYVAVGWTTALLVVGIVLAVNASVLDSFSQLSTVADTGTGMAIDPDAVNPSIDRFRFYAVTQATVIASGWFAGMASRGRHEALLHSGLLVLLTYVLFTGTGML